MKRAILSIITAGAVLWAAPAAGQTPAGALTQGPVAAAGGRPTMSRWFLGGTAGVSAVQKVGGVAGGDIGFHITDRLDVFGEGLWMQNVVTRRRLDVAATVAAFLQATQGKPASSTIEAPGVYAGGGLRIMLATGRLRPYIALGGGSARVALRPAFTLGGTDVTSSLSQYGVTLGSDLTGELTKPAFNGGVGVRLLQGRCDIDGLLGVTSIRTPNQPTNVVRAGVRVGFGF